MPGFLEYIQSFGFSENVIQVAESEYELIFGKIRTFIPKAFDHRLLNEFQLHCSHTREGYSTVVSATVHRTVASKVSLKNLGVTFGIPTLFGGISYSYCELIQLCNVIGYLLFIKRKLGQESGLKLVNRDAELRYKIEALFNHGKLIQFFFRGESCG